MEETVMVQKNYLELITEQLCEIDTNNADNWDYDDNPSVKIVEEQKTYFWIRLYLNEENKNTKIGNDIIIKYQPMATFLNDVFLEQGDFEELETKFICYDKKGMERDHDGEITNYNQEDDTRVLCLMVDSSKVNGNSEIPFIRTLFKASIHYDYQIIRRSELLFIDNVTGEKLEYYDCDF